MAKRFDITDSGVRMDARAPSPRPAGTPVLFTARMAASRGAAKSTVGEVFVYDEIGWYGITAATVAAALAQLKKEGAQSLNVYVNSPGGDVFEGVAIYNVLRRFAGEKVVHIDGLAASMATIIAMAGDRIVTAPNGMWMVHNPWSYMQGDGDALRQRAELLDQLRQSCIDTYASRTKQSAADIAAWMAAETWMTAEEALARGFTDEVREPDEDDEDCQAAAPGLDGVDPAAWPTLAKFKHAPPEAMRLLSLRASAKQSAAKSRTTPAEPVTPRKEQKMDLKTLLLKAVAAGLMTQEQADAMLAAQASTEHTESAPALDVAEIVRNLTARLEQLQAEVRRPASDPSAAVIAAATEAGQRIEGAPRAAPRIAKYKAPRAAQGREKRTDEQIVAMDPRNGSRVLRGMPLARALIALARAKEIGQGCSLVEACDLLGFRETADRIAGAASSPMSEGDAAGGAPFVPAEIMAGFIDSLEHQVVMRSLIPAGNIIKSARETIQVTKLGGGVTGAWVGENPGAGSPGKIATGVLTLRARKQRIEALISRDQLRDSTSNIDQIAYQRLALRSAQLEDLAIVEGKGTENEPKGLKLWAGYNTPATALGTAGYENSRKDLRGMLKKLASLKVPAELGRAFVGAEVHKWVLGDQADNVSAHPHERELDAGRLCGQPARFSTQFSTGEFHCFAPGAAMLFDQLDMLLESDNTYIGADGLTYSASASDEVCLRLWRRMDFGMAHTEAAMYITSVPWT